MNLTVVFEEMLWLFDFVIEIFGIEHSDTEDDNSRPKLTHYRHRKFF